MCRKPGGKAVTEIIAAVTITREGTELNTKTTRRLKQTSVSVEKVFCCCDEPVPLLAFRELGGGEKRERRDGVAQLTAGQAWLKPKPHALVCVHGKGLLVHGQGFLRCSPIHCSQIPLWLL